MSSILTVYFPDDFEERYRQYKALLENGKVEPSEEKPVKEEGEKYPSVKEDIVLQSVGIEIKDMYVSKGANKFKINPTDRKLIDFLHYRSIEEKLWASNVTVLEKELGKTGGYIRNRISKINNGIKKIMSTPKRTTIDDFIKYESGRGYLLNSRYVIDFTKK